MTKKKTLVVPPEIEEEILSRLPVKSLLRFKCIQKSWRNLIENPTFITMHLNVFGKNNDRFLLYYSSSNQCFKQYYRENNNNNNSGESGSNEIPISWVFGEAEGKIIGSSNGLVCLCNKLIFSNQYRHLLRIHILNPSTRKILELPKCDCREIGAQISSYSFVLGFAFCPKLNDYKVVKIIFSTTFYDGFYDLGPSEVQVYSLSTNSWKKKIIIGNPKCQFLPSFGRNGFINGACYWLGRQLNSLRLLIIAFKFDEEVMLEINLPNHFRAFLHHMITEYQNLLCLICIGNGENVFDVWVRKDSWVKQFSIQVQIPPRHKLTFPLMILNLEKNYSNGELLLLLRHKNERKLVWYNTKTNQIEEDQGLLPFDFFTLCNQSLVSLPPS